MDLKPPAASADRAHALFAASGCLARSIRDRTARASDRTCIVRRCRVERRRHGHQRQGFWVKEIREYCDSALVEKAPGEFPAAKTPAAI
jgi:hypothetical protein